MTTPGSSPRWIPVSEPAFVGNERKYVNECLDSTWISSMGEFLDRFEDLCCTMSGARHAVACTNGTAALHLALLAIGVSPGDEVIVPTLTYVATANAVTYCGATPVFVDSEPCTWNIDPALIEAKINARTKAIVVVHLYGHPVDWAPIAEVARRHGLPIIEDAAEAHGAQYQDRPVGSLGDIAIFSFYGNKIVTTGEGGVAVTSNDDLAATMRQLRAQGVDPDRRYWFPMIGFNYRMTNLTAAIGVAQLERLDWHIARRREVADWYREMLADSPVQLQPELEWAQNVYWMSSILLPPDVSRDEIMARLLADGIETRPFFYPCHCLPMYAAKEELNSYPVADDISRRGMSLPSFAKLSRHDVAYVVDRLRIALLEPCFEIETEVGVGPR